MRIFLIFFIGLSTYMSAFAQGDLSNIRLKKINVKDSPIPLDTLSVVSGSLQLFQGDSLINDQFNVVKT